MKTDWKYQDLQNLEERVFRNSSLSYNLRKFHLLKFMWHKHPDKSIHFAMNLWDIYNTVVLKVNGNGRGKIRSTLDVCGRVFCINSFM